MAIEVQWAADLQDVIVANDCQGELVYVACGYQQSVTWTLTHYELGTVSASATTEPNTHTSTSAGDRFCVPVGTYIMEIAAAATETGDCCTGNYGVTLNDGTTVSAGTNFDSATEIVFGLGVSVNATSIQTVRGCTCQNLYMYDGVLSGNGQCTPHATIAGLSWCKITDPACGFSGCDAGNGMFGCGDFGFDYCSHVESVYVHVTANEGPMLGNVATSGTMEYFVFDAYAGLQYDIATSLGTLSDSYMILYGTDGTTVLQQNDDYGGLQSRIPDFQCSETGTYVVAVRGYSPSQTGTFMLEIDFEVPEAPCGPSNPCYNDGVCVQQGFGFNCQCPEGFSGPTCARGGVEFDICDSGNPPPVGEVGMLFDGMIGDGYDNSRNCGPVVVQVGTDHGLQLRSPWRFPTAAVC